MVALLLLTRHFQIALLACQCLERVSRPLLRNSIQHFLKIANVMRLIGQGCCKVGMAEASAATTIHVVPVMRHIVVAALASAMLVVIVFPTLQQP